jgi:hypothetical protein
MAYTIPEIIVWSKMCQPLARIGEAKKLANGDRSADVDLDMKIYITRKDTEYSYAQEPTSDDTFAIGNYLLALCGIYLFVAQQTTIGGGTITPVTPPAITTPTPYDFIVTPSSFIAAGDTSKIFPSEWIGYDILFVRNHITQSKIDDGIGSTYYAWNKATATLSLFNGAAVDTENFQIFPV